MSSRTDSSSPVTRREAIRRASLLLGVTLSPSLVATALKAQTGSKSASARPLHLTQKQFEILGAVAERILPRTDTPGALDVGVPAFIDLMYGEYIAAEDRKLLSTGLDDLNANSNRTHRKDFAQLSAAVQDSTLRGVAEASQSAERTFFHVVKELTVAGYFTSEQVGKTVLHYDPVPGRYQGCIPLSEVGNVNWTR